MKKRLFSIVLVFCLLLSMAACGASSVSTVRPENWDVEAEILRYCNGFYMAKTAEQLKPYVLAETPDKQIQQYMDNLNESLVGTVEALDYRDYPYDSVEATLLDTYKGYEIFWVKTSNTAFQKAEEEYSSKMQSEGVAFAVSRIAPNLLCVLTIENGRYVTTFDEALSAEVLAKYDYCHSCGGMGKMTVYEETCSECGGTGAIAQSTCNDCGEMGVFGVFQYPVDLNDLAVPGIVGVEGDFWTVTTDPVETMEGDDNISIIDMEPVCPACQSSNITNELVSCTACPTESSEEKAPSNCPSCDGKGWIKK